MTAASSPKFGTIPRFRLSTLFILVACAAIGLATTRDVLEATRVAIAATMAIGLLQQVRVLGRFQPTADIQPRHDQFPVSYAVCWRIAVAAMIALYVLINLGGFGKALLSPDREDLIFYEPATTIYELLPIIVLVSSVRRWKSADDRLPAGHSKWLLFGLIATVLTAFIVADGRLIEYLVHKAMAGIEASISPRFQRSGTYPNHSGEGYRSFWVSLAAATSVFVGAFCCVLSSKQRSSNARKICFVVFVICLVAQAAYCRWFYSFEFHRIAPDLAGVGLAAVTEDWLLAAILVAATTTAIAYCLSASTHRRAIVSTNLADNLEQTALHETALGLAVMLLVAAVTLWMTVVEIGGEIIHPIMSLSHLNGWMQFWTNLGMLSSPMLLLIFAQSCLVIQLCYIRWRRREQEVRWELPQLSARALAANWIAVALAVLAGIPTLGAFGFEFWLGPFNFSGI